MMMGSAMRRLFRIARADEGTAAVEWAIILSPLVLLLLGIMEFANAYWTWNTMELAVGEGARYAMVFNQYAPTKATAPKGGVECSDTAGNGTFEDYVVSQIQNNLIAFTDTSGFTIKACTDTTVSPSTLTINITLPYGAITLRSGSTVPLI